GMAGGESDGVQAAQAERDQGRGLPAVRVEHGGDVGGERLAVVARRPVRIAVTALIEGEHVVVAAQVGRDLVEAVRRLCTTVQEEQRRRAGLSPVEEVEAETGVVQHDVAGVAHAASANLLDDHKSSRDGGPWRIAWSGTARYRSPVISVGEAL